MDCPVCFQQYALPSRVPQVLNCGHTFCSSCLEQVAHGGRFRCPTCREETSSGEVRLNFALRDALLGRQEEGVAASAAPVEAEDIPPVSSAEVQVAMYITPASAAAEGAANMDILLSVVPQEGSERTPSDICCVVDVSTSMGTEAMAQDGSGVAISHGLALLDIVKHALRTIIHILGGKDRLAIVAYGDKAHVILELTPMTEEGRRRAELRLHQLQPEGMTNLWDGLQTGIQLLSDGFHIDRLQHVLLLTDGIPNLNPPRGIAPMLKRLKDKSGGLTCTVNTFGFGYDLDSELLGELAGLGCGSYAFIPDAGFVGTVFVNAVTNLLVTMATNVTLSLEPIGGASLAGNAPAPGGRRSMSVGAVVPGGLAMRAVGQGLQIELSSVQFGQSKDFIVCVSLPADGLGGGAALRAVLQYRTRGAPEALRVEATAVLADLVASPPEPSATTHRCRQLFVDGVQQAMAMLKQTTLDKLKETPLPFAAAQEHIKTLEQMICSLADMNSEAMAALMEDLSGQVSEALSKEEWYLRWGIHFLPSLLCAHRSQQCNNFKDPGVQHYGGELFVDLRDQADDVFCGLEAPKPQPRPIPATATAGLEAAAPAASTAAVPRALIAPAVVDMSMYYDRCAG